MQIFLDDLDQALTNFAIPFEEVPASPIDPTGASSWRTRGRPASTGSFEASGVLCHHTASPAGTSDQAELNVILAGNGSAPGPISQLFIGRSAIVYLVAAGRCNHAGHASIPWIDGGADTDGNAHLIGIEVGNSGVGEHWPDDVCDVYARVVAALITWYGYDLDHVVLHATTGPPAGNFKIDPAGPWTLQPDLPGGGAGTWSLDTWRGFVNDRIAPQPQPPDEGDDLMAQPAGFITCNAGVTGHHLDGSDYSCPVDGTTFWVSPAGTIQWVHGGELDDKIAVEQAAGRRTDTWNTPVGSPDNFGRLEGDKPHL